MSRIDYSRGQVAQKGRDGDEHMAHVAKGEMVVPPIISDELRAQLLAEMQAAGLDPEEYTVGGEMSINPETGLPEFGFLKKVKKVVSKVTKIIPGGDFLLPLAANYFLPGVGSALGGALGVGTTIGTGLAGAGLGALTGGGKGALLGGLGGALSANIGDIGSYAGKQLGGLGDSLSGALSDFGDYTGLTGALTDASGALDGTFGDISNGISDAYKGSLVESGFNSGKDVLNSAGINTSSAPAGAGASGTGSSAYLPSLDGIKDTGFGINNSTLNSGAEALGGNVASKNFLSPLSSLGIGSLSNLNAEDDLLQAVGANKKLLAPYQNFSFNPGDLTQDPGYQFNLAQGQQAQDRAQLARGGFFSGQALKEAQDYGQGLADNTYNQAFQRAVTTNNTGLQGALALAGQNDAAGAIKAKTGVNIGNLASGALADYFGGNGYSNTGALMGGQGNDFLTRYLKQLQLQG